MLQLRHLDILRFRSVPQGTRLLFNAGHNILLGKNGTGKTTLLKLIAAAASANFHEFQEEEFELAWVMTLGEHELRCNASHRKDPPSPGPELPLPAALAGLTSKPWRSHFDMEVWDRGSKSGRVTWRDGQLETERGDKTLQYLTHISFLSPAVSDFITYVVMLDLSQRKLGKFLIDPTLFGFVTTVPRLDESLVWFHHEVVRSAMLTVIKMRPAPGSLPYILRSFRIPSAFFASLYDNTESIDSRPFLEVTSDDQPMLKRACEALGFVQCTLRVEFDLSERGSLDLQSVDQTLYYKNIRFFFTKKDGTRLSHTHLSFGQLRLFAFLYYAELYEGVIVADELTNGLHHAMIDLCLDTIGDRQSFLATQNPLLLDHMGFRSAQEVQRTFILCDLTEMNEGQEAMQWRNMKDEEASEFFGDYQVGIQHVNDILRTRGLW